MTKFKRQIPEEDYWATKPEYEKIPLIIRQNRTYMENDPYRLIDGEIFIGEDAYWELKDTEKYDGQVFYFRNDDLKTDFKVYVQDKEFIPSYYDPYAALLKKVEESLPNYRGIFFIRSEEEFQLLSLFYRYGMSNGISLNVSEIGANYYRGTPDWYFFEGEPADSSGPSTYRFETLAEKKRRLNKLCKILKEKEKNGESEEETGDIEYQRGY